MTKGPNCTKWLCIGWHCRRLDNLQGVMAKEAINFILHSLFELGADYVTKHLTIVHIFGCVRRQVREGIEGWHKQPEREQDD